MALKGLILSMKELNIVKEEDPEDFVMEDGLTELLDNLYRYEVQIINTDMFQADTWEKLSVILKIHGLEPEECLMIAATSALLHLIQGQNVASIGYCNPRLAPQDLARAEVLVEGFEEVDFFFLERIYQRQHGIPWTVIETERCLLREMTLEDLDELYALYAGRDITKYMEGLYEDRKEEEAYTRAYIDYMYRFFGYGMWLVLQKDTGNIIGRAGLNNLDIHGTPSLEMGYMIGVPYQRQGYAMEVCRGIMQFAEEGTEFEELNCLIRKGNDISVHMMEKLGFSRREEIEISGKPMDRYIKNIIKR